MLTRTAQHHQHDGQTTMIRTLVHSLLNQAAACRFTSSSSPADRSRTKDTTNRGRSSRSTEWKILQPYRRSSIVSLYRARRRLQKDQGSSHAAPLPAESPSGRSLELWISRRYVRITAGLRADGVTAVVSIQRSPSAWPSWSSTFVADGRHLARIGACMRSCCVLAAILRADVHPHRVSAS